MMLGIEPPVIGSPKAVERTTFDNAVLLVD